MMSRYEIRERNGRWGVWDRHLARWEALDDGTPDGLEEMSETDAEQLARDLNGRPAGKRFHGVPVASCKGS